MSRHPVSRLLDATSRGRVALLTAMTALASVLVAVPVPAADAAVVPAEFTFTGGGWGHGIGMSQYGAQGQAVAGRTAEQILEHYYAPAQMTRVTGDPTIDVQLLNSRSAITISAVGEGETFRLVVGDTTVRTGSATLSVDGGVVVARVGTSSYSGSTVLLRWGGSGDARLVSVPYANADSGTVRYRYGHLRVSALNGRPNVVNRLRLHTEYLYGLAEMPSSWQPAALQAQTVAGRSYALRALAGGIRTTCGCHVYDEVASQKFTGWNKAGEVSGGVDWGARWRAAVDATITAQGAAVMTLDGRIVETVYSSSTGGRTTPNEDAWGTTAQAHLRSRDDAWSQHSRNPYAAWTVTRTQAQVATTFGLPDVARLEVTRRSVSGAVMQVRATSSAGRTSDLVASPRSDAVRTAMGLRSPYFQIGSRAQVQRFAGADRYETAVALGRAAFPTGGDVVLVNGRQGSLVDGLVAAPLARSLGAPVLLSAPDALPAATKAELVRRGATRVHLVGGTGVLTSRLVRELEGMGMSVARTGGADRYETAAAVARELGAAGGAAVVASGQDRNLVDAAAVSGAAARTGRPVLLVRPDHVPTATGSALDSLGVARVTIAGGTGVVSQDVARALAAAGMSVDRAGGADRYATAAALASRFAGEVGTGTVLLAGGATANLVDSLTGGVLGHVTLLVHGDVPQQATRDWFTTHEVARIRVAGGTGAVSDAAATALSISMS